MPEIAEVHRFVDQLNASFGGQNITKIDVLGGRILKDGLDKDLLLFCFPLTHVSFHVKGKFIYCKFRDEKTEGDDEPSNLYFMITLGMTGSFGKQNKHSAIRIKFDNGEIFFNDIRHFGTWKLEFHERKITSKLSGLGWDCLNEPNIPSSLFIRLRKKNHKCISEVMLDQSVFAGLGNYLRSEILYAAGVSPFALVSTLSDDKLNDIATQYKRIATAAYNHGGATIATYANMNGDVGNFSQYFQVYGKKQDPKGNQVIAQKAPDGRTVHWVKEIQI